MLIAVPCVKEQLCMHFGHCDQFALVKVDEKTKSILSVSLHHPPPHEPGVLPKWLSEKEVDVIVAGGMGMRAQSLFKQYDIAVITGAQADSPEKLAMSYISGTLTTGENVCDH